MRFGAKELPSMDIPLEGKDRSQLCQTRGDEAMRFYEGNRQQYRDYKLDHHRGRAQIGEAYPSSTL